jgi:hypothetical protein
VNPTITTAARSWSKIGMVCTQSSCRQVTWCSTPRPACIRFGR